MIYVNYLIKVTAKIVLLNNFSFGGESKKFARKTHKIGSPILGVKQGVISFAT